MWNLSVRRALAVLCALAPLVPCAGCGMGNDLDAGTPRGPRPYFSFFVTTQIGQRSLPGGTFSPVPDPVDGFGGDLGGLAGADEICSLLAQTSNPGDSKVWRAFLSTSGLISGERVDALDRIGNGPWYDFRGFKLAGDLPGLLPLEDGDGRPAGADPELAAMFTGENGEDVRVGNVDNHDTLTGSNRAGRLFIEDGEGGRVATCNDWTSSSVHGTPVNRLGIGGQVPVGHSWPRSDLEGRHWINEHTVNGCGRGGRTDGRAPAPPDDIRVGGSGGYGGFYCFALDAIPPRDGELSNP